MATETFDVYNIHKVVKKQHENNYIDDCTQANDIAASIYTD